MSREARERALLALLTALATVPVLSARFLPLFDYPAHLSVAAALHLRGDPETGVAALYDLNLGLMPNSLHYAWTWALSAVMPVETASRLFLALFCVAALPLATAFALRAFGRDWRLAVLAIPVCYGRSFFFGFVGFCAAIPLSLVVLALVRRELEEPRLRREVLLGLGSLALPFLHFFTAAVTVGLAVALVPLSPPASPRTRLRVLGPLATGPLAMVPWFLESLGGRSTGSAGFSAAPRPPLFDYPKVLAQWFIDAYTGHFDEWLAALLVVTVAALIAVSATRQEPVELRRIDRIGPLVLTGALLAGFAVLPFELRTPFHWWAMNVRLVPLAFLWMLIATPAGTLTGLGRAVLLPASVAILAYLAYLTWDFRERFNGPEETGGLAEVLGCLPKGARVEGLYTDLKQPQHYVHYPYAYAASYAVVTHGGVSAPFAPIPQAWTNPREVPAFPVAGNPLLFRSPEHLAGFTHFLVRTCTGDGCLPDPLAGRAEVEPVLERGRWRLYRCIGGGCLRSSATVCPR